MPEPLEFARWFRFDQVVVAAGEETSELVAGGLGEPRPYDPMEVDAGSARVPRLLAALLDLRLAPDAFERFASDWGLLGIDADGGPAPPDGVESFRGWATAVLQLQSTFQLWAAVEADDRDAITELLARPWWRSKIDAADRAAVTEFLQARVNGVLAAHTATGLVADDDGRLGYRTVARSLIGAAWLQFALLITHRPEIRRCGCGRWFIVRSKPGTDRYCGSRCRKRAQRQREKQRASAARDARRRKTPHVDQTK